MLQIVPSVIFVMSCIRKKQHVILITNIANLSKNVIYISNANNSYYLRLAIVHIKTVERGH